ncbi:MAG: rod shape-determining protein MreD [Bacteroidales bacterium]
MINYFPKYIISFILLVALQVLVLNNIQLSGYLNPYVYILFILTLPNEIPGWALLVLAFVLGMTIDLFSHTLGMHSSATVFMAFLRPMVLRILEPRSGYDLDSRPSIGNYGLNWFFNYAGLLVLAHHIFLFYIEVFKVSSFFQTLSRALLSAIFSLFLILLIKIFVKR